MVHSPYARRLESVTICGCNYIHKCNIKLCYYTTSTVSGQDEPNPARAVIGYPSGQDGAILPARDFSLGPARSVIFFWFFIPYNKSFIDQV